MSTINISTLNKGAVLAALFNASRQQGMGFMHTEGHSQMTEAEATELLKSENSFDYLRGRVMKITIEDELRVGLYDRDNGQGAAAAALAQLFAATPKAFKAPQAYSDKQRPAIELKPVDSNKIKAIGYDADIQTLAVVFKNGPGAIYHYPNFTPEAHAAFVGAESLGKHFSQHIQNLPFEKFQPEPVDQSTAKVDETESQPA